MVSLRLSNPRDPSMPSDEYPDAETAQRRDKVLNVMLHTPPKPHAAESKSRVGKSEKAPPRKGSKSA